MSVDIEMPGVSSELELIVEAIIKIPVDPGAPFEAEVVTALRLVRDAEPAEYQRLRQRLKTSKVSITALEKLVNQDKAAPDENTVADELLNLVNDRLDLFHVDKNKKPYASFDVDGHRETHALDSSSFSEWLAMVSYRENDRVPSENAITTALRGLSGQAKFDGQERSVFLRVADFEGGYILDLGDPDWSAVHITANGWEIVKSPPVRFWRTQSMLALPKPKSGSYERIWEFVNVHPEDQLLLLAFILDCWRNDTAFPILELIGEQGTAKSTTQENIRALIDPTEVMLRAAPKNREDLFVSAKMNWIASYNNLSYLKDDIQDAFCQLATGGGHAGRKLYTDDEENAYNVKRPVIINGISALTSAQDMLDRVIRMELPIIKSYRTDSSMEREFKNASPEIMGGLLDLFARTLSFLPAVKGKELKDRMADFIQLGQAMLLALGIESDFEKMFKEKKYEAFTYAMESSAATNALLEYMADTPNGYEGTFKTLLTILDNTAQRHTDNWPKSPKGLADLLRKNAPALRAIGIGVKFDKQRHEDGYHVKVFFLADSEVSKQSSGSTDIQAKTVQNELPEHENTTSVNHTEKIVSKTAHPELHELKKPTSVIAGNKKSIPTNFEPVIPGKLYETPDSELFVREVKN